MAFVIFVNKNNSFVGDFRFNDFFSNLFGFFFLESFLYNNLFFNDF